MPFANSGPISQCMFCIGIRSGTRETSVVHTRSRHVLSLPSMGPVLQIFAVFANGAVRGELADAGYIRDRHAVGRPFRLYLLLALFLNASTVQQSSINMNADANQKLSKWEVASKAFETDTPTFSQRMMECKEEAKSECG